MRTIRKQCQLDSVYPVFKKSTLIIHYFVDSFLRDLDNFDYKSYIDSIRKLRIIKDNSYKELFLFKIGDVSNEEHINVYVVPHCYTIQFLQTHLSEYFTLNNNRIIPNLEIEEEVDFWDKWAYEY